MNRAVLSLALLISLTPFMNGGCDPSGLAPGLTGESNPLDPHTTTEPVIALSPANQDITDQDYAFLYATTANLPEPSADNDGIHSAARIRWTIVSGGGGLNIVDSSSTATLENAKVLDTDPATDLGGAVLYFPDTGASGAVTVKAELIRPTDRTEINAFGEPVQEHEDIVLASAQAVIHVNDELRLKLTPPVTLLPAGGTVSLKAILEALETDSPSASDITPPVVYEWNMTGLAGAGDLLSSADSDTASFTAGNEAATFTVTVKAIEILSDGSERTNGPASATVQVDPKLRTVNTFGYYLASDISEDSNYYSVVAWLYFPKIQGAVSYRVVAQGMHDDAYYGTGWSWNFGADPSTQEGVDDLGGEFRMGMSSAGGAVASGGAAGAYGWMDSRFSGMRVIVTATVRD